MKTPVELRYLQRPVGEQLLLSLNVSPVQFGMPHLVDELRVQELHRDRVAGAAFEHAGYL